MIRDLLRALAVVAFVWLVLLALLHLVACDGTSIHQGRRSMDTAADRALATIGAAVEDARTLTAGDSPCELALARSSGAVLSPFSLLDDAWAVFDFAVDPGGLDAYVTRDAEFEALAARMRDARQAADDRADACP